jgi:hypothetical protein
VIAVTNAHDLTARAARLDQAQRDLDRAVEDINYRARAAGTHLHDQWQARQADLTSDHDTDGA